MAATTRFSNRLSDFARRMSLAEAVQRNGSPPSPDGKASATTHTNDNGPTNESTTPSPTPTTLVLGGVAAGAEADPQAAGGEGGKGELETGVRVSFGFGVRGGAEEPIAKRSVGGAPHDYIEAGVLGGGGGGGEEKAVPALSQRIPDTSAAHQVGGWLDGWVGESLQDALAARTPQTYVP